VTGELLDVVRSAVATALERDAAAVPADAQLREELGVDSLALLEMAAIVEQRTRLRIADEDLDGLRTPRDVVEHCEGLRGRCP
jgi:acyl carrier protein